MPDPSLLYKIILPNMCIPAFLDRIHAFIPAVTIAGGSGINQWIFHIVIGLPLQAQFSFQASDASIYGPVRASEGFVLGRLLLDTSDHLNSDNGLDDVR